MNKQFIYENAEFFFLIWQNQSLGLNLRFCKGMCWITQEMYQPKKVQTHIGVNILGFASRHIRIS